MKIGIAAISAACACAVAVSAASASYLLYAPRPTEAEKPVTREEGVLVKEITIRRGDTLSAISRAYSGHASYFPQILLFNQISNPDLIYAGATLRVPVSKVVKEEETEKEKEKSVAPSTLRGRKKAKTPEPRAEKKPAVSLPGEMAASSAEGREVDGERSLYEKALKTYRSEACNDALPVFDAFLKKYPDSVRAADIALFRADCYLKLSEE